jgi:hypothetical protein
MTLNPSLAAGQAKLLIDALLEEPLRASRTADDLVDDLVSLDGGGLGKLLFNRPAVGQIMSLPEAQRQHIATHMRLIAERVEAGIARLAQATALDRAGLAQYVAAQETARATEAEAALAKSRMAVEVAAEVNRRLTEIAAAARAAEPAPPATPEMLPEPARTPVAAPGRRGRAPLFSAVEVPFLTDKQRGLHGYSGQTTAQVRTTFRLWVELVGDKPVPDYTGADAGHFRELVLCLPASHGKGRRIHAMDAIRVADRKETERGELITRLTMKTAKRHFSALSQLWEWLRPRDHVEKNIFRGFSFPGTKSKKRLRDDWSEEDLLKLLSSPWYRPEVEREAAQRWLPVIAMFSGLRLEEICRLRPAHDITEVSGVPVFKIQDHPDPEPWSPKSEAGERVVPIHPVLIEMGVLGLAGAAALRAQSGCFPNSVRAGRI